jgi:hypothetical protein
MRRILLSTIAAAAVLVSASAHALDEKAAYEIAMTPDIARQTGEINAAVNRCAFKLRASERVFATIPLIYYREKREDLLTAAAVSSQAFHNRFDRDPVGACEQARSRYWDVFQ